MSRKTKKRQQPVRKTLADMALPEVRAIADAAAARVYAEAGVLPSPGMPTGIVSTSQRSVWDQLADDLEFHPDELLREKGFVIYDEMLATDGEIRNAYALKIHCLLAPGWEIVAAEKENPKAGEIAQFVEWVFEHMQHSFQSFLTKFMDVFRQGFKLAEPVWRHLDSGPYAGQWGLRRIFVRNSRWYRFAADVHGEVKPDGIIELPRGHYDPDAYIKSHPPTEARRLPKDRFVCLTYGATDDNAESLYGRSDFRAAYRYYFYNKVLSKLEGAWLERWSDPQRIGKYPPEWTPAQRNAFLQALEEMGLRAAAIVPEGGEVELHWMQGGSGSSSPFDKAITRNGLAIARSMLVGDLVQSRGQVGSYALGKQHFATFLKVLQSIARELGWVLNTALIRPLVEANFADHNDLFPRIQFSAADEENTTTRVEVLKTLKDAGMVDPNEDWIREWVGLPDMDPELRAQRLEVSEAERDRRINPPEPTEQPVPGQPVPPKRFVEGGGSHEGYRPF